MTAYGTTETAIEATKRGAFDYLLKPFEIPDLLEVVSKALMTSRLMSEPVNVGSAGVRGDTIIGASREMQMIYKEIGRVAAKPVNVLIRGETGSGKELIARALCQHSDRANAPFIAINCAAIPETLLESELFGHERGAFTGAEARRLGRFEQANGGTIFLDEIGDMTPGTQVKLVRVLQERSLQRLGGKENIPVDVRVIAATHRDLERAMEEKQFREDLYYRLSVVVIRLPALRERREDIPELIHYFLQKHGPSLGVASPSIHPDAMQFLQTQSWPGNVRELENVIRKVLLLAGDYTININHVRTATSRPAGGTDSAKQSLRDLAEALLAAAQRGELAGSHAHLLEAAEKEIISQAIELTRGNQLQAARLLGISRLTLREKLTRFGLRPNSSGES
jgi:DNA-binding NtrC family response regulator